MLPCRPGTHLRTPTAPPLLCPFPRPSLWPSPDLHVAVRVALLQQLAADAGGQVLRRGQQARAR